MNPTQITKLHALVHAAQATANRPWEKGETSRPIEFFTDHLGDDGWRLGWELVGALRETAPDVFGSYGEVSLHRAALDILLSNDSAPDLQQIAQTLRDDAGGNDSWIVVVPLANVRLDRPWAPLGPTAALQRAAESHLIEDPEARQAAEASEFEADNAVRAYLGDRLAPAARVLNVESTRVDTGRAVSIISKQEGPPLIAIEAARARALYALATWAVLAPPGVWHLMPDIATWTPQPDRQQRTVHKRFQESVWEPREPIHGGDYREWGPYELPTDEVLSAPFEAFEHLDRRPAQALLSATAAVHAGNRATRSQLSERLRDVRAAIESLCTPPPGGRGNADKRWEHLARHFRVWDQVANARAYTPTQIEQLQKRVNDARNISAHRSEAALIDLGWTQGSGAMRGRGRMPAADLAITALQRDIGPMLFALAEALHGAWGAMRVAQFDEAAFEALFT